MENEFDKQIDAMLRAWRPRESVPNADEHLDADVIAAFAENALPDGFRRSAAEHFADCRRCRTILADVAENTGESAAASMAVSAAAARHAVEKRPALPWWRQLFTGPKLAYTLGGLIVVCAGMLSLSLFLSNSRDAEVSSISRDEPARASGPNTVTENEPSFQMPTANQVAHSNSAANASAGNASPAGADRTTTSNAAIESKRQANTAEESSVPLEKRESLTARSAEPIPSDGVTAAPPPPPPAAIQPAKPAISEVEAERSEMPRRMPMANAPAQAKRDMADKALAVPVKVVGGRRFVFRGGVWTDQAYNGTAVTRIARGSAEFAALDAGLRSIADELGGTSIVVWKGKAYRFQ